MSADYITAESLIRDIEADGEEVSAEEKAQVEMWRKGRDLDSLLRHPGFLTLRLMIQDYATDALREAMRVAPGDNEKVVAVHAVAFTLNDFYVKLFQDIDQAVLATKQTPEIMRRALRRSPIPIEGIF